ncbi:MAG TPA: PH domain-containing protein [Sedimentisphaerales bacterium]|nr:PH domain-containing protein [Sedimentisphaerales bacterium]
MATVTFKQPGMKQCPFCSEMIRVEAIKCRFCAEFLNTDEAKALEAEMAGEPLPPQDHILFAGRPSVFGMVGAAIKAAFFVALGILISKWPIETVANELFALELTEQQLVTFGEYRILAGLGLILIAALLLLVKMLKLKMTRYEVTADRIEWSRGVLDRKVDNLDMFRVIDLKLRRSLLDCALGIGTVELIATDKTDPQFTFEKMRDSRTLYDVIKKASLEADRRSGVVHLE